MDLNRSYFALLFLGVVLGAGMSRGAAPDITPAALEAEFDAIAGAVVDSGRVDYVALKAKPGPLDAWLGRVAEVPVATLESWRAEHQMAFYINAYNGLILSIVRDHYPIRGTNEKFPENSIQQIPDVWTTPHRVASRDLSLDQIEKAILIGRFMNPRVHFALNCASRSCPPLRARAYRGASLGPDLNRAAQDFIRTPQGAQVDIERGSLRVSSLFDWYSADFALLAGTAHALTEGWGEIGSALEFVSTFLPQEQSRFIRAGSFQLDFLPYDWSLND